MPPRFYCPLPLHSGQTLDLPAAVVRHVQVLRLQPGRRITLFQGQCDPLARLVGGEFDAEIVDMQRQRASVRVGAHRALEREAARSVHLLVASIAHERMDWLVEKATELGAARITVVHAQRSVQRLEGARAQKKRAHWQAIAAAACEQCGRNRLPVVQGPLCLDALWQHLPPAGQRLLLSLADGAQTLGHALRGDMPYADTPLTLLCGPEGGWSAAEEAQACAQGFVPTSLGPRTLRAETAPLAALATALLCAGTGS